MTEAHAHVACPACLKANRIPVARLGDGPKCGGCGTPLLDGKPVALDERSFDAFVGRTDLPVVVDFWAPWCAPCRAMAPAFEAAAADLATRVRFAKLNTEDAQEVAVRFGIRVDPDAGRVPGRPRGGAHLRRNGCPFARALGVRAHVRKGAS